jgi:uncharacterized protein HemX
MGEQLAQEQAPLPVMSRPRARPATALLVATGVLVVAALALGAFGVVVRNHTSDLQAQTRSITRRTRRLIASESDAARRARQLENAGSRAADALGALLAAYRAQVEASNHAVDLANQAANRYNHTNAGLADAFKAEGDAAVTDVATQTAAMHVALTVAKRAITELQDAGG